MFLQFQFNCTMSSLHLLALVPLPFSSSAFFFFSHILDVCHSGPGTGTDFPDMTRILASSDVKTSSTRRNSEYLILDDLAAGTKRSFVLGKFIQSFVLKRQSEDVQVERFNVYEPKKFSSLIYHLLMIPELY